VSEWDRHPGGSNGPASPPARILRDEVTMGSTMCADEVAESLVADLERLAGEARHV
jgi:hypothetical protein